MSSTINFPYTTESNYTYDSDKIEFIAGKASLKLTDKTGETFNEDFASDTDFTYDNTKSEFTGGLVRQIDLVPTDSMFGANYDTDIDGNWGGGVLTGTATGGAAVSGGKLDLVHGDVRYVTYEDSGNFGVEQTGTIRFKCTPNYSGTPSTTMDFFAIRYLTTGTRNLIVLRHIVTTGEITLLVYGSNQVPIVSYTNGVWSPTSGVEYEIELNFDVTSGATRLFIDGVQLGATQTNTGTRSDTSDFFRIGSNLAGTSVSNFAVDDVLIFSTVQHTSNYTSGYSVEDYNYLATKVELPQLVYSGEGNVQAFTSLATTEVGAPREVWNDKYWSGSAWVTSNGSYAQANSKADILTNIATFPASDTLDIDIVFDNSNSTLSSIADLTVTYTGEEYDTNDPVIVTNTTFLGSELLTFSETKTVAGSDMVKYIITVSGQDKWSNAGTVENSDGTYAKSNTAAEITTAISDFVTTRSAIGLKILLHSDDGTTSPNIDINTITYDASLADVSITTVDVNGYNYSGASPNNGRIIKYRPYQYGYISEGVHQEYVWTTLDTTDSDGYFSGDMPKNPVGTYWEVKMGIKSYLITLETTTATSVDFADLSPTIVEEESE